MGAKFSDAEVEAVDLARGDTSRSEWLRTAALAAAGKPARSPAGKPVNLPDVRPPGRVPFREPVPCSHPKARVHKNFCGACGSHVG
jgi:hypothetical protein